MKTNIILDIDDTLINTNETIISILQQTYKLPSLPIPTLASTYIRDWNYNGLITIINKLNNTQLTLKDILSITETPTFWSTVTFNTNFDHIIATPNISLTLITSGTPTNLSLKTQWLSQHIPIPYTLLTAPTQSLKTQILPHHPHALYIDDNINCLTSPNLTNILLTNHRLTTYNNPTLAINKDIYIVNDGYELEELIQFIKN